MTRFNRSFGWAAIMVALSVIAGCGGESPVIPDVDACPNLPGFQAEGPCEAPKYVLIPTIEDPKIGTTVFQGGSLVCRSSVVEENAPAGSTLTAVWRIGGIVADCKSVSTDKGPELVAGASAPVTTILSIGSHTVSVEYCNSKNGECRLATSEIIVTPPPDQILALIVEATYPNWGCADIWTADAVPGATPRRLTTGCHKGTFAVSRDGKTLWYGEDDGASNRIWKANLDGSNPVAIPVVWNGQPVTNITNLRVSPDGSKISFMAIELDGNSSAFVMNSDGTGLRTTIDDVYGVYATGIGSAWMPDNRHLMVVRDSAGMVGNTFQTVQNEYLLLDLETGEEETVYISRYDEDQYNSILRGTSDGGGWSLHWEIQTTGRATIIRTDGSGEVRPLTERDQNASSPIFCGEAVCAASSPTTVFRVGFDGQSREDLFTVNGWVADLGYVARSR